MCLIDAAERMEFATKQMRTARKAHCCGECQRTICAGEKYEHMRGKYEGRFNDGRTCSHCLIAREWLVDMCAGYVYENVYEDLREHMDEPPPIRSMWLGRAIVGMRRKWARRDGSLMVPLPHWLPLEDA